MNKSMLVAITLAVLLNPLVGLARGPAGPRGADRGGERCAGPEDLDLSAEQKKAVERAEQAYRGTIRALRNQGLSKRLELQELLSDPKAGEDAIRAKGRELVAVQAELHATVLEYRLQIRSALTPTQLARWCRGSGRRMGRGFESCFEP